MTGKGWIVGNDIDTDLIYPGRFLHLSDRAEMGRYTLAGIDPELADRISAGDVLIAGRNLGCGSSREQAVISLREAGIASIIAVSTARIFLRNCVNNGLPVITITDADLELLRSSGTPFRAGTVDLLETIVVDPASGLIQSGEATIKGTPTPPVLMEIVNAGGLVPYVRGLLSIPDRAGRRYEHHLP